ncbi:MAG: hypothetical protein Q9M75_09590, partial [Ghiorsea sp.]|nr:hypothetical protein [Ghiorsea sp.]
KSFPASGAYPAFDGQDYFTVHANPAFQQRMQAQYQAHQQQLNDLQKQYGLFHFQVGTHEDVANVVRERLWTR